MRTSDWLALALPLVVVGCPGSSHHDSVIEGELDTVGAEDEGGPVTLLARFGSLVPRGYLFAGAVFGREGRVAAQLVRVDPDVLVVRLDRGGEREIARGEGWPMACLTQPLEIREGALNIALAAGAPVLILASSEAAARVSIGLQTEHSEVVRASALAFDACPALAPAAASGRVADVAPSDAACVYADQESLDGGAGVIVPARAPVQVLDTEGEWARVRVSVEGGTVTGWMAASLIESGVAGTGRGFDAALGRGRCVFVGRVDGPTTTGVLEEDLPQGTLSPAVIAGVMRQAEPEVRGCYDTRRTDLQSARVTLELSLLVDPDGRVYQARVTRGRENDAQLTECVEGRARRWRFPPPGDGVLQVRHAFELGGPTQ